MKNQTLCIVTYQLINIAIKMMAAIHNVSITINKIGLNTNPPN
jgi:hypothetical protein